MENGFSQGGLSDLYKALSAESDRGCALIAAAMLDAALESYLYAKFVDDRNVANQILEQSRPIGSFSSRIDLVYLLGGISKEFHRDLHIIRKIRNKFGHSVIALTFDDPLIKPQCNQIQSCALPNHSTRSNFVQAAIAILGILHGSTESTSRCQVDKLVDVQILKNVIQKVSSMMPDAFEEFGE